MMNRIFSDNSITRTSFFVFIILLLTACKNGNKEKHPQEATNIQAAVLTLKPEDVITEQSYPANLEGRVNVELRPQVSGYIDRIYVDEGAYVKAGQPLFKINASIYREQKNTVLAALEVSRSQLISAKLELEKYKILSDKKVVGDFQFQKAKANYESAKAAVSQQQALVASSDLNLGFTEIKAPVGGYIGRIPKRVGSLVSPSDVQALTTLSQVDVVYVYFSMPETEVLSINQSQKGATLFEKLQHFQNLVFQMADGNVFSHTGKIDMMDGQFDKGTGSVALRASFPNPEGLLRSGNTGRIILKSTQTHVFKIPVLATYEMQDKLFAGLLNGNNQMNRVELKDYKKSGDYYIVQSGFKEGDKIVANELAGIPEQAVISPKYIK